MIFSLNATDTILAHLWSIEAHYSGFISLYLTLFYEKTLD